jgi:aconitate hydratase
MDPEPHVPGRDGFVVASAETLAYAVASGEMGDPRLFKRPVRVTVPRVLPTDDVLVARERRSAESSARKPPSTPPAAAAWKGSQTLDLVDAPGYGAASKNGVAAAGHAGASQVAVVCTTLDEVRQLAAGVPETSAHVRAVIAPFIPSGLVSLLSAAGVAALQLDAAAVKGLREHKSIVLPAPARWATGNKATAIPLGTAKVSLTWLASSTERDWAGLGTARPTPREAKSARGA